MSCLVAFHYRSYGTFFLQQNRLHKIHRGFTHYKYYRAANTPTSETSRREELPNTGTEANANLAALGLLGALSGFGLLARKKKED